jgi:hypothetical protein
MAVTFVAVGTAASGTGNITPGLPADWQENDIFLLFVETADQAVSTPSGWTLISYLETTDGPDSRLTAFWKRATSSESDPTISDPGNHAFGVIIALRGCNKSGTPLHTSAWGTNYATVNHEFPAVTTTVSNCFIVHIAGHGRDTANATWSSWLNANLSSLTERFDAATTAGNGGGIGIATGTIAAAGNIGPTSVVQAKTNGYSASSVALTIALCSDMLVAGTGVFTITGTAAGLTKRQSFVIHDCVLAVPIDNVVLVMPSKITCEPGSFTITGTVAGLLKASKVTGEPGGFTITGTAAGLLQSKKITCDPGQFTFTGINAGLIKSVALTIHDCVLGTSVNNVVLIMAGKITCEPGAISITGSGATLKATRKMVYDLTLTIHDCVLAVTEENIGIIAAQALTIHDCVLAVIEGNITLLTADPLTIHDCVLAVSMDNTEIAPPTELTIHDCILAVEAENVTLGSIPRSLSMLIAMGDGSWRNVLAAYLKIGNEWKETEATFIA